MFLQGSKRAWWLMFYSIMLCVLVIVPQSHAQTSTAEIIGNVTDDSGAVVAGAEVTATNLNTGLTRTAQSSASGDFTFSALPIGTYSIAVKAKGFKTFAVPSLTLATGDRRRVDAKMEVGALEQTVEVTASAPTLQTDSATVGGLVTSQAVQDLPLNGRNIIQLAQLVPGATEGPQSSIMNGTRPDDRRQSSAISANGQQDLSNNYMIDGMDNNERAISTIIVKPSVDAIQEVKVSTNLYSAEIGRNAGAVVNMITKSGTNSFHGTLFEYFRNDVFDAKSWNNIPQAGNPLAGVKPEYRQNQFGGSIGGPIRKDKLFFFADYEALRIIQGVTQTALVPTACELGRAACNGITQLGNFSDSAAPIYDPATHQRLTSGGVANVIPLGSISKISQNYAALFPTLPASACTGITCLFVSSPNRTQFAHTGDVRIDYHITSNDSFSARYTINNTDTLTPSYLPNQTVAGLDVIPGGNPGMTGFPGSNFSRQQSLGLGYTHIFGPSLLLDLKAQVSRFNSQSLAANNGVNVNTAFGGPGNINVGLPGTSGLALLQFSGAYGNLGDAFALPTAYWDTDYQYAGSVAWTRGNHSLKFGSSVIRRTWSTFQALFKANYAFSAVPTNSLAGNGGTGGNAFASMLAGVYTSANRNLSLVAQQPRVWEFADYVQDDWRATRWLTLNLGLRYDIFTAMTEKHNLLANFDPTDPAMLASKQIQIAGAGTSNTAGLQTKYNQVQPMVGFAASLSRGFVVRGGFGMTYYPSNVASPAFLKNPTFAASYSFGIGNFNAPVPAPSAASPCLDPSCGAAATAVLSVPAATAVNFRNAAVYMFNVMVQKQFGDNTITIGYVGEPGRHLGRVVPNIDLPLPPNGPGGCGLVLTSNVNSCQPYAAQLPRVSSIQILESDGSSNYNALQTAFERRTSKGLTVSANYTYSHAMANVAGAGGACTTCAVVLNNPGYDWGESDYEVRHRFAITANYELPFGKSLHGFEGQVGKGWQINGLYTFSSGLPFNVSDTLGTQNTPGLNQNAERPNMQAERSGFQQSLSEWFDTTRFQVQAPGTPGNEPRNSYFAPAGKRLDLSVFKSFPITESVKLQFRADIFNLTNTPGYAINTNTGSSNIGTFVAGRSVQSGTFGKVTDPSAFYTPRVIQFALKLLF